MLFRKAIPWLLLFATCLFIFGERLNGIARRLVARHRHAPLVGRVLLLLMLLGVCIYGGFFNAGLGIIILSYLALAGHTHINAMNGIKLLISSCVSLVAIALFVFARVIAWPEGISMIAGALAGGYLAARISRRTPQGYVRGFVAFAGTAITLYFFYATYV